VTRPRVGARQGKRGFGVSMTSCREPLAFGDLDLGLKWAWHRFSLDFGGAVSFFSGFLRTADFPWNLPTLFSSLPYCRNIIKVAKFAKFAKQSALPFVTCPLFS